MVEATHPAHDTWVFPEVGEALFEALRQARPARIVLQVPAGLIRNAPDLVDRIRTAVGAPVVLGGRARVSGACDFPSQDEVPRADVAVVLGHAPIPNVPLPRPTYFVEMRETGGDPSRLADLVGGRASSVPLGARRLRPTSRPVLPSPRSWVAGGLHVRVGRGDRRLAYAAQALGCNYTGAEAVESEVDGFLFLGTGMFHPIGLAFAVDRPVWSLDPLQGTLEPPIDRGALDPAPSAHWSRRCRNARRWGILVSSFGGQNRTPTALALQERARATGPRGGDPHPSPGSTPATSKGGRRRVREHGLPTDRARRQRHCTPSPS